MKSKEKEKERRKRVHTREEREGLLRQSDLDVAVEQLHSATRVRRWHPVRVAHHWVLDHTVVSRRDRYHPLRPKHHAIEYRRGKMPPYTLSLNTKHCTIFQVLSQIQSDIPFVVLPNECLRTELHARNIGVLVEHVEVVIWRNSEERLLASSVPRRLLSHL